MSHARLGVVLPVQIGSPKRPSSGRSSHGPGVNSGVPQGDAKTRWEDERTEHIRATAALGACSFRVKFARLRRLNSGKTDAAEKLVQQALDAFPNYPLAVNRMAEVRTVQTRYDEALNLFRQCYKSAPRAENLYDLAKALHLAKHEAEADQAFADFKTKSLQESGNKDNSNRDLIFYYADYAKQPAEALRVAELEYARRKDVYTLDAYAWALHVLRQNAEALRQIKVALSVGVRDAQISRHAAEISLKSGDVRAAEL